MMKTIFRSGSVVLDRRKLAYNPCDDLIFPSVIRTAESVSNPLAAYYMYYAPHNSPGGVCLAYADRLEGPWTEYPANPVIKNAWPPHYAVQHVSSPHALYQAEEKKLFLFFHGDNDTTRFASSADGVRFEYRGVSLDSASTGGYDAVFYARFFPNTLFRDRTGYLAFLPMLGYSDIKSNAFSRFGIFAAWSPDACRWHPVEKPLLDENSFPNRGFVCSPWLFDLEGRHFLLFHKDSAADADNGPSTDVYIAELDGDLGIISGPELFCDRKIFSPVNRRFSDPCLVIENDEA